MKAKQTFFFFFSNETPYLLVIFVTDNDGDGAAHRGKTLCLLEAPDLYIFLDFIITVSCHT